jgi:1-acyl-sn-glycerol-3-phosphate acyltransferase
MNILHLIKYSKSYNLLRRYTTFWHSLFYKEIVVVNKEIVSDNESVIFAPNHQNALMDALAIICTLKIQPVFMARADIFKKKAIANLLYFFKIIPVYRIRDGIDQLQNNDESFNLALQVLQNRNCVGIMPEGNHGDQHRLRPLKKGLSRFALQVQEKFIQSGSLKIIPVGIDYSHYTNFRSKILVIYGNPIVVSDFMEVYAQNPQKGMSLLREQLAREMKSVIINIDSDEYYNLICTLTDIYLNTLKIKLEAGNSFYEDFQVKKIISDKLVTISKTDRESLESLLPLVNEYISGMQRLNLTNEVFEMGPFKSTDLYFDVIRYTFFLPFAVAGILFHLVPAIIIKYLSVRVKDTQFQSSVKFVLYMVLFPLYYFIILALRFPIYTKILVLLIMPVLGILSYDFLIALKRSWNEWRYNKFRRENNSGLNRLIELRKKIIKMMDILI